MNESLPHESVRDLVIVLAKLEALHRELDDVVRTKIERMRASDIDGIREMSGREGELVGQIAEQEELRRQLVGAIGPGDGSSAGQGLDRPPTCHELARRFGEPHCSDLLEAADRLRAAVARVAASNRLAGLIAQGILRHFRHVFATMTGGGDGAGGYSDCGRVLGGTRQPLFDAVG